MAIHAGANGGAAIPRGSPDAATIDDNFHSVVGAAAGADTGADLCAGVAGFQLKGTPVDLNFGGIEGAVILASAEVPEPMQAPKPLFRTVQVPPLKVISPVRSPCRPPMAAA